MDSLWITPHAAISDAKKWNVIFPTKLNLMKLDASKTVAEAISPPPRAPRKSCPSSPGIEDGPNGQILKICTDAGYTQTTANMRGADASPDLRPSV